MFSSTLAGSSSVVPGVGSRLPGAASCRAPRICSGSSSSTMPSAAARYRTFCSTDCCERRSSPAGSKNDSSVRCGSPGPASSGPAASGRTGPASGGEPEHQRCPVAAFGRRRGRGQQLRLAVERLLVVAGEPLAGTVVGAADRRVELLPELVHQLVDEHGHEDGLAGLLRADQHDQAAAHLPEVHGQLAVAGRADPGRGLGPAPGQVAEVSRPSAANGRRQRAGEPGAAAQHRVDLRVAAPAVPADPAGAPEPDLLLGEILVAVRAVQTRAGRGYSPDPHLPGGRREEQDGPGVRVGGRRGRRSRPARPAPWAPPR